MKQIGIRLMDRKEDYQQMGTKRGIIEPWEDGKRDDDRAGVYEWWYFDFILDDGSKAVIHFNTKDNKTIKKMRRGRCTRTTSFLVPPRPTSGLASVMCTSARTILRVTLKITKSTWQILAGLMELTVPAERGKRVMLAVI